MDKYYSNDKNTQILIVLLKAHGIRKIVTSPGKTNMALVGSCQYDPWFEVYSCVDERSAAYMACGLADESGEPVVITCTGATASRNYLPGLTEAYYRKLPVLAVTFFVGYYGIGNLVPQVIDRSVWPKDTFKYKVELPHIKDDADFQFAELKMNTAILELTRNGGGPAHINLATTKGDFSVKKLPEVRVIKRINYNDQFPILTKQVKRVAIYICSHAEFTEAETQAIDAFCKKNDAVVFCDHTSRYKGKYRTMLALLAAQEKYESMLCYPDMLIHIGELSGDYMTYNALMGAKNVWRVSSDGEVRDTFHRLTHIFDMEEQTFFEHYTKHPLRETVNEDAYLNACIAEYKDLYSKIPELPFSNNWVAKNVAPKIPEKSVLHLGLSNTLRSWTFFDVPKTVSTSSNVGCRGIDGVLSTFLGASLVQPNVLHFCVLGDLTFFYDMNAIGNRHVGNNLRIILVNNGKGMEFRLHSHPVQQLMGDDADAYVAAAGHFGEKSPELAKGYSQALGFEYLSASNKEEFDIAVKRFLTPQITDKPMLLEVFTDSESERNSLQALVNLKSEVNTKKLVKAVVGKSGVKLAKKLLNK
tara:strand:+ start:4589 stop:6346 length:1758 start_codon:yes stop_codon:yes gene_type:complete